MGYKDTGILKSEFGAKIQVLFISLTFCLQFRAKSIEIIFVSLINEIEHISNKIASLIFALSQIKYILPVNIRLLVYNSFVRPHIEYGIVT